MTRRAIGPAIVFLTVIAAVTFIAAGTGASSATVTAGSPAASPFGSPEGSPIASPVGNSKLLATVQAKQGTAAAIDEATADARDAETATVQAQLGQTATSEAIAATAAVQAAVENAVANATQNAELQAALVIMATSEAELDTAVATADARADVAEGSIADAQATAIAGKTEIAEAEDANRDDAARSRAAEATSEADLTALEATAEAAAATIDAQSTEIEVLRATGTAIALPTATPTNTPEPTATNTPQPTATSLPQVGDFLYRSGKTGFKRWPLSAEWKYLDGMLINDGSGFDYNNWIRAPYSPGIVNNYAVEVEIQRLPTDNLNSFGIVVRGTEDGGGYRVGVTYINIAMIADSGGSFNYWDSIAETGFDPGSDWHTYRVEVQANVIRLLIDDGLVLEATDNQFLDGGDVGLFSFGQQLNIRGFRIIALDNGFGADNDEQAGDEEANTQAEPSEISAIEPVQEPAQDSNSAAGENLPDDYLGTWTGTGVQSDLGLQWEVVLSLTGGAIGTIVGTSSYPGLGCQGNLTLLSFDQIYPPYATLAETIVTGQGVCADGTFQISFAEGVQGMMFSWTSAGSGSIGTGTMQQVD